MKIHDVEQGTPEWLALRLGIPTASDFHRIVTPSTGKLKRNRSDKEKVSEDTKKYAYRLVSEAVLGEPLESIDHLEWIGRGKLLEPRAVGMYQASYDVETCKVGFITSDDGSMGCSPDRLLVNLPGDLEIKCPAPNTHIGYLIDGPGDDYRPQCQGRALICGWEFVDFFSFHPSMPPVRLRFDAEAAYVANMRAALAEFCDLKDAMIERAKAEGYFEMRTSVRTPYDDLAEEERLGEFLETANPDWGG